MTKADEYRVKLRSLDCWDPYLLKESGLPGPRGNLELAQVVADEGERQLFQRYVAFSADIAPTNSPFEFLAFCGVVGLGRLLAEGDDDILNNLRNHASDPRWRIREAVAMALQRLGDTDMDKLIVSMQDWSLGTHLEQRAVVAAICEPRLLGQEKHARAALQIVDEVTDTLERENDFHGKDFTTLRKGLGYCWSVAVAALPVEGKALMEKRMAQENKDIHWVMKENLKKARLVRMDAEWVKTWSDRMEG